MPTRHPIKRLLIANRGEIAIRIHRACAELGIRTIGIHSDEDRYALHRFKADEAYSLGEGGNPVGVYLDIPRILEIAESDRRRRDPSGLRLPLRARRLRQGRDRRRHALRRSALLRVVVGRRQGQRSQRGDRSGSADHPGLAPDRERPGGTRIRPRDRLPGHGEGLGRRRRSRHARRRDRSRVPRVLRVGAPRSGERVRQRRGLRREADRAPQAHRGPDPRRHPRRRRPPLRTRLFDTAPSSEGPRAGPGAEPRSGPAREAERVGRGVRPRRRVPERRHGRVPGLRRRLLLHRDEPARPGRAHRHGGDHGRRHRRVADPRGHGPDPRRDGHLTGLGDPAWLRDPMSRDDRESRESLPPGLRSLDLLPLARRFRRSARCGQRLPRRDHHALLRLAPRQAHDPRPRPRRGVGTLAPCARRVPRPGRRDQRRLPAARDRARDLPRG